MNQPPNPQGIAIIVGTVVGIICGLIPLAVGRNRERDLLGRIGFALTALSGFIAGLIGALPMAGLMSLVIMVVGPPAQA